MILLTSRPACSQECAPAGSVFSFGFNGKAYEIIKEKKSWAEAAACAVERGGYLVLVDDSEEQAAIFDAVINGAGIPDNYVSVPDGGGIAYVWIGATDQALEGEWKWDGRNSGTGTVFWTGQGTNGAGNGTVIGGLYNNWGGASTGTPKEPDDYNSNQDGAAVGLRGWPAGSGTLGIAGEWNDISSANSLYFIIEYDPTGINELREKKLIFSPNPVKLSLTIASVQEDALFSEIRVLTGDGKEAKRLLLAPTLNQTLDFSGFPPGKYVAGVGFTNGAWYYHIIIKK